MQYYDHHINLQAFTSTAGQRHKAGAQASEKEGAKTKRGHLRRSDPWVPQMRQEKWRPLGDSNPCYRRERAVS